VTSTPEMDQVAAEALRGLKDFQRETVDYVFERLYAPGSSRRFLVADEVGLGKTMVARGVIARTIEHLRSRVDRIDVIYICSNADIARQNINRLKVPGEHVAFASRLTLLPEKVEEMRRSKSGVNFVSLTPGTSFDLKEGFGRVEERVLLYAMLRELWGLGSRAAPMNVFQGGVRNAATFRDRAGAYDLSSIDPERKSLAVLGTCLEQHDQQARQAGRPDLRARFEALTRAYARDGASPPEETRRERARFVGELRTLLAASCIAALEPDLIILDEFQRFGHLLDGAGESGQLARELFGFQDVAVLLLSATPYKMYTAADEAGGEDHYRDFVRTLRFLERSESAVGDLDRLLTGYRKALLSAGEPGAEERIRLARGELESRLRRVMVRTERLASTPDRNGMLCEKPPSAVKLRERDVHDFLALQEVARTLEHTTTLEYWKSAPFVLNFMEDYKLKRDLLKAAEDAEQRMTLARALSAAPGALLRWEQVTAYGELDPGNGRMRALLDDTVGKGAERLLWIPPALPYYRLSGPFGDPELQGFTKRLVFSSWRMVPRAIAACVSYEAERRMIGRPGPGTNTPEARKRRARLLRFGRSADRLTGMPVLALMYPSVFLARACDPAQFATDLAHGGDTSGVEIDQVLGRAEMQIELALRRVQKATTEDGSEDERWYWAAPLLLDQALEPAATQAWFAQERLAAIWAGQTDEDAPAADEDGDAAAWDDHVQEARAFATGNARPLGRAPADLVQVLARIAIGAPGVTMLRAMLRVVGMKTDALSGEAGVKVRDGAAQAAWSFRGLFNQAEVMSLLEGEAAYWRQVLDYCVSGCLQSVLDEYAHVLRDHLGLVSGDAATKVHEIAGQICEAMSLRTANLGVTDLGLSAAGRTLRPETRRMRCHFALRFGDEKAESGEVATRADSVRKAFNSPFWPFVVATTSVGQEGLDFHTYCHVVVHWNLPSNPVDLEQREGRVHRFKGHAVRKNVALVHGFATLEDDAIDVWEAMFEAARRARADGATDVVPFWVYPVEGGARIERHVPAFPLSREYAQLNALSKSLAVYRMVFGQPRQDDLLRYLIGRLGADSLAEMLEGAKVDLAPGWASEAVAIMTGGAT
jgi:hypothetical protein